jgi:hypothetical protein
MNTEDSIDWAAIPGSEWYRPEKVAKAITGIRTCDSTAPDILYQVANNHSGELYPAAVNATSILLEIVVHSENHRAAMQALSVLDTLAWFRGVPPFQTILYEGVEVSLDKGIRLKIKDSRTQLMALANREKRLRKMVLMFLESIDQQATE